MSDIRFTSLTVANFKSFLHSTTVDLDVSGVSFLKGTNIQFPRLDTNGVGKSSLLEALTWVLKGRTISGLRNPDVRARKATGTTVVKLQLTVDNTPHLIQRTISPNKLTLDGNLVGQDVIDRLIPLSLPVISNTMIFGQGKALFFDLEPREKMELLSEVLTLERWDARADKAGKELVVLDRKLIKITEQVKRIETELTQSRVWIERAKKDVDEWNATRKQKLENTTAELVEVQRQLKTQAKLRDEADLKYDFAATEQRALATEVAKLRQAWDDARATGKPCPKCKQPVVDPEAVSKAEKVYLQASKQLEKFTAEANKHQDQLISISPQVARLEEKAHSLTAMVKEYDTSINPYKQRLVEAQYREKEIYQELDGIEADLNETEARRTSVAYWAKEGFKLVKLYLIEEVLQELQIVTAQVLEDVGLVGWTCTYAIERETKAGTIQQGLSIVINPPGEASVKWGTFSGGEGQRLRLAGALALATVLLNHAGVQLNFLALDEPTQRLSPAGIEDLCTTLADYAEETQLAVWFIDQHAIESSCFSRVVEVLLDHDGARVQYR